MDSEKVKSRNLAILKASKVFREAYADFQESYPDSFDQMQSDFQYAFLTSIGVDPDLLYGLDDSLGPPVIVDKGTEK